ncbi:pilus assembly protein [Lysobacter sp. S4-A87]|uniref:pilus assembly protein n=1 Tax=Lysobacter sp. S4-A87 TaxID=2925843 RepID=UPI001F532D6E|nr:PilC/PilY family type IV pilus protein [Lysobacter sp. S4-A87]UNK50594.1 pilus assembly protein [Lysobacter sp. S4-A87]
MKLERLLIVSIATAGVVGLLALTHYVGANATRQGDGILAQEPMHLGSTVSPNFIMAIDDSGSMTFQTMFPGADGEGCWSSNSFFNGLNLRTSGSCDYLYVLPGTRINNYRGIPPFDAYGFARSPDYNPTYYSPDVTYDRWVKPDLQDYANASLTATLIDPRGTATVNLFGARYEKNVGESFFVQDGMVIPKDTKYTTFICSNYNNGNCNAWRDVDKSYTAASSFTWNGGAQPIAIEYTPGTFYLKADRTIAGYDKSAAITNACGTGCSLYRYTPNEDKTRQNFANWYSFYGNRNRAMVAGLTRSLKDVSKLRVGYFTINARDKNGNYTNLSMRDMDVAADKTALLTDVIKLDANGSTPNRFAVENIGKQFDTNTNVILHACQKNAGMLFTDGYSNQDGPTVGNADSGLGVPFEDTHSDTLADIAAYYYNRTLRSGSFTAGRVPTSNPAICESSDANAKKGVDCKTNLHMNFYGITLGARGKQFGVNYGVLPNGRGDGPLATKQALASATSPAWEVRTNDNPNTVDEIWHATMTARGSYINAQTPAAITNAMRDVLASVGVAGGVSGSIAITGTKIGDDSLQVTPRFGRNGTDWYGDVAASKPTRGTGGMITYTASWTASTKLPAATARNLLYATTTDDSTPTVADFVTAGPSTLTALCANYTSGCGPTSGADVTTLGVTATQAVAYLSGDRTLEGSSLRTRTSPLGDIVNSSPLVAAPTDDFGYALMRKADGSFGYDPYAYNKYLDDKKTRKRMVYVGANDGMLHAFHGDTGVEQFGFIPATAVGYMGNLLFPTSPNFQHRYFVDGPVAISDALFATDDWRTVLVGTSGAGGRSVFGLDISDVGKTKFAADDVLWEVNDKIAGAVGDRIGYVLGKPLIVPVRDSSGKPVWKAVFGGGYGNKVNADTATTTIGTATLFVVDMKTGDVDYIDAKETGGPATANGLGNIVAIDQKQYSSATSAFVTGSDGMIDTVYGGDLHGNVWKFDLTKSGTARLALGGKPLFTAKDGTLTTSKRQAITGGFEAALGPRGGVMLLFGTGSFSYNGDKENRDVHSIYGVLDMPGELASALPLTRANLVQQSAGAATNGVSAVSNSDVDYYTSRGWYVDLVIPGTDGKLKYDGERMVSYPRLDGGTLYFATYAPTAVDACSGGGTNYLYGLNALSGGGNLGTVRVGSPTGTAAAEGSGRLTLETDGSAPVKDVTVLTTGKQGGLSGTPDDAAVAAYDALPPEYCMAIVSVAGSKPLYRVRPCGRQSWRQIR